MKRANVRFLNDASFPIFIFSSLSLAFSLLASFSPYFFFLILFKQFSRARVFSDARILSIRPGIMWATDARPLQIQRDSDPPRIAEPR